MGLSTVAKCRCGYSCWAVFGGPRNACQDRIKFPHYCAQCGLVNANPYKKDAECPQCQSADIHRYGVETSHKPIYILGIRCRFLERTNRAWYDSVTNPVGDTRFQHCEFSVTEGDHCCPACRAMTLRFDDQSIVFFD